MIHRRIREWDYIAVDESSGVESLTRRAADELVSTARASGLGGEEGESILVNGHRRLRAQQVVGILACPSATLEILPKIDGLDDGGARRHLVHMLARVLDLDVASGALVDLGWQQHDLLEVLIRLFCDRLFEAVRRGLPRRYVGEDDDLPSLRGRLDVRRQFTVLAASPQRLACRFEDLSHDIAINQIMRAAVSRLLGVARAAENQRRLTELSFAFTDVQSLPSAQLPWDQVVLDRTNTAWVTPLKLARLLLGDRFQTTSAGDACGFSLLFEMNTLFEEYIGRTLRRAVAGAEFQVQLQGPRDYALTEDSGARRFATKPDIVVSRSGKPVLIIDTKWKRLAGAIDDPKRGVGQADVYQMMAYAQVYRCDRLLLLYPHHEGVRAAEGLQARHLIRGTHDARLGIATVALSDLTGLDERLARLLNQFLNATPANPCPADAGDQQS